MSKRSQTDLDKNDNFKKKFKYYKCNKPKPSLKEVISFDTDKVIDITPKNVTEDSRAECLGLNSLSTWKLYTFINHDGLLLIKNPFTSLGERYWIRKCLEDYPKKPNKINIDVEMDLEDWWSECLKSNSVDRKLQKKLRWTTCGYHHNWDTKVYTQENKSAFPDDLAELSDVVAKYLGFTNFKAQAAIVNYYHMDSTLSAHTDHSEINLEAPLLSYSFGQSAVFLIGGKDKSIEPSALLINSGDIVVMSKEARLCYHAVPKILRANQPTWRECNKLHINSDINTNNFKYVSDPKNLLYLMNSCIHEEWDAFHSYIEESRINMNVRQVLNEEQFSL